MTAIKNHGAMLCAFSVAASGLAAVLVCALGGGCGGPTDGEGASGKSGAAAEGPEDIAGGSLRVGTYNAGLAPGDIEYVGERLPEIASALAEQDLDLLCLNEIWRQDDWNEVATATSTVLPHRVRLEPDAQCAMCSPVELDPLAACIESSCTSAVDGDLVTCALTSCGANVEPLSGGCAGCLLATATEGRLFGEVRDACAGGSADAPSYLYGCGYDTGILSAREISASETRALDSYLVHASVDYARVSTELGSVDVFCTHLASSIPEFEYRGAFGDWEGEHAHQVDELLAFIEEKASGSGVAILLGDLNAGPGIAALEIPAAFEEDYQRILDAGFENPYLAQGDAACLSCTDNTLRAGKRAYIDDHILVRGYAGPMQAERVLTDTASIDVGGMAVETHLSDHFGLALTLGEE